MNTEYESGHAQKDDAVVRWLPRIAILITILYGLGWIWIGGTDATGPYAYIGGPLIALLWVATGWVVNDRRRTT